MQRNPTISLLPLKSIYKEGKNPRRVPDQHLYECQNAIIKGNHIREMDQFLAGETVAEQPLFVFLKNKTGDDYANIIALSSQKVYGKSEEAASFTELATGRTANNTYANCEVFQNVAHISAFGNAIATWDFAAASLGALTTPPSENCYEIAQYNGMLVACGAATNPDYVFFSTPGTPTFQLPYVLRSPSYQTGYTAMRAFNMGQNLMILTNKCPVIITGAAPMIRQYDLVNSPGLHLSMLRCACKGMKGVYYFSNDYRVIRNTGESYEDISSEFFGIDFFKKDIELNASYSKFQHMWSDAGLIYFAYISQEVGASDVVVNRILVYDEYMEGWVSDIRSRNVLCATTLDLNAMPLISTNQDYPNYPRVCLGSDVKLYKFPVRKADVADTGSNWETISSVIESKVYNVPANLLKDFVRLFTYLEVQTAGNLITKLSIDGSAWTSSGELYKSISLAASGPRYGDEDNTTVTRIGNIKYPWILSSKEASGYEIQVRFEHSGTKYPFVINDVFIESISSLIEDEKERARQ